MKDFLSAKYFRNTIEEYLIAAGIILITIIVIHVIKKILLGRLRKTADAAGLTRYNFIVKSTNRFIIPALYLGAIYLALDFLSFGVQANKVISTVYAVAVAWFGIRFVITAINYFIDKYFEKLRGKEDSLKLRPLIALLNSAVWITGLLFLLDNLGFQISTIIAGLGISGIAVALAAQALLGDLFGYFVIFFDRPFEIGDFIAFENNSGSIEKIGIKTTRIRSLTGEQLIVSNSKLTSALVHNYKRMERRRVAFNIGVTYKTNSEHLKSIPGIIKEIINKNEKVEFDRAHFQGLSDSSLNFEIVYFVLTSDYLVFMNIQEKINLDICGEFSKRGIDFAYPTRIVYINKEN